MMAQGATRRVPASVWLGTALVSLVTIMSGTGWGEADKTPAPKLSELNTIRGVVKPSSEATLASQIEGRISRLPFKDGQRFKKGNTLVQLDCAKYKAQLASAQAEHAGRKKTLENNARLLKLHAIGSLEVEVAHAEVKKAFEAIKISQVNVRGCRIRAPFSGRVDKLLVNEHENVFPNDELLSILDDRRLEIDLILPSKSLGWLKAGTRFKFTVDETGRTHAAKIREIGARVDPVSQTIQVIGVFQGARKDVLAGMSGTATFPGKPQ